MLFFVDETRQRMHGVEVGALGAVAMPQANYNAFCRQVYAIKKTVLGASEFTDRLLDHRPGNPRPASSISTSSRP
jgi:hypothetical protein